MEFEKKFKKELQRREIQPSSDTWKRLQERLDEDPQPKRKSYSWLWKVAAMAVVFFGLGTLIESPFDSPQVVIDTPEEQILQRESSPSTQIVSEEEKEEKRPEEIPISEENIAEKRNVQGVDLPQQRRVIITELVTIQPELPVTKERTEPMEFVASEELAQVTDSEIDALLVTARQELSKDSLAYAAQFPRAEELLKEVEFELDESFRRKVFDMLKEGYSKARTAVANRDF